MNGLEREIVFELDSFAVSELVPPKPETYLHVLNHRPLPRDVRYSVLVGNVHSNNPGFFGILENLEKFGTELESGNSDLTEAKALILNLLQANFFQGAGQTLLSGGDGIVSTASQNLNNLDQFKKDPEFNAEVFYADDVHHLKECWKHRYIKTILEI